MQLIIVQLVYILTRVILSNDVHPGPRSDLRIEYFTFGHLNACSLNNEDKFDEISVLIKNYNFDIFAVSETWVNSHILQRAIATTGYGPPLRQDRSSNQQGGGVALYCSDSIVVNRRLDLEVDGIEILWVDFKLKQEYFLCAVCYRPPNNRREEIEQFFSNLQASLDRIAMLNLQYTIILGDFNINVINNGQDANTSDLYAKLNCFLAVNGLVQLINEPIRVTNHSSTVLDLIITNSPGWFTNSGILSPPSNCDHSFIFGKIATTRRKAKSFCRTIRRFSNVDVQGLNQALKNNMDEQLAGGATDINVTYNKWFEGFTKILHHYIPAKWLLLDQMISRG